ncbi:hypothetical protein NYO98_10520 [Nocardioides sp. STR2]|uniref:Holliday junction resolvase RusA (Prophage-encoded endonuclease) n=1 Tax=Nocardioides pini TaxID=2975053 RepID=A0ABT4CCM9_9ACTN|nr:hypothetical protein [Nocardioides pini]MCY4726712.1 hypothetical protein [Nocardioides pini]
MTEPPLILVHTVRVPLPWDVLPLSQNQRLHWRKRNDITQDTIEEAGEAIAAAGIPHVAGCEVVLHHWPATRHRKDADNMAPTLKACIDALVAQGVITDDSWIEVPFSGQHIHTPTKTPPDGVRFVLEVRPCAGDAVVTDG